MGLPIHTLENPYAISGAIQDFTSFEFLSFGFGGGSWAFSLGTKISC